MARLERAAAADPGLIPSKAMVEAERVSRRRITSFLNFSHPSGRSVILEILVAKPKQYDRVTSSVKKKKHGVRTQRQTATRRCAGHIADQEPIKRDACHTSITRGMKASTEGIQVESEASNSKGSSSTILEGRRIQRKILCAVRHSIHHAQTRTTIASCE